MQKQLATLLIPADAARELGITRSTLAKMRAERRGPSFVRVGRLVRYRPADLAAWLEKRTVHPEDQQ